MSLAILLAEDHDLIRRAIKSLLETDPEICVVAEATTLREAIQRAAEFKPEVVVLDLHMVESQFEASQVKTAFADTRLIAISAWDHEEDGILAKSYGAAIVLDKMNLGESLIPAIRILEGDTGSKEGRWQTANAGLNGIRLALGQKHN